MVKRNGSPLASPFQLLTHILHWVSSQEIRTRQLVITPEIQKTRSAGGKEEIFAFLTNRVGCNQSKSDYKVHNQVATVLVPLETYQNVQTEKLSL